MRPPRPAYRDIQVPNLDNSSQDSRNYMYSARARSLEALSQSAEDNRTFHVSTPQGSVSDDQHDFAQPSGQRYKGHPDGTGNKKRRPPYQYPNAAEITMERKRPPYKYPTNTNTITADERALMRRQAQQYDMYSDTEA